MEGDPSNGGDDFEIGSGGEGTVFGREFVC